MQDNETAVSTVLAPEEKSRLSELESVIKNGMKTFFEVGKALKEIQTSKLYREEFERWEDYIEVRWDMQKRHAYRLIDAADVRDNIQMCPMGHIPLPETERQIRPLTRVKSPDKQIQIWESVVNEAEKSGRRITAKMVEDAVIRTLAPEPNSRGAGRKPAAVKTAGTFQHPDKLKTPASSGKIPDDIRLSYLTSMKTAPPLPDEFGDPMLVSQKVVNLFAALRAAVAEEKKHDWETTSVAGLSRLMMELSIFCME